MPYYEGRGPDKLEAVNAIIRRIPRVDVGEIEFYGNNGERWKKSAIKAGIENFTVTISHKNGKMITLSGVVLRKGRGWLASGETDTVEFNHARSPFEKFNFLGFR